MNGFAGGAHLLKDVNYIVNDAVIQAPAVSAESLRQCFIQIIYNKNHKLNHPNTNICCLMELGNYSTSIIKRSTKNNGHGKMSIMKKISKVLSGYHLFMYSSYSLCKLWTTVRLNNNCGIFLCIPFYIIRDASPLLDFQCDFFKL